MTLLAKDIMVEDFDKINLNAPVDEAIQMILNGKVRKTGHKTVSLMVIDDFEKFVGIITMFDILYHLRPSFLNYGIYGEDLPWEGQLKSLIEDLKKKKIEGIMSPNLVGASPDEHLMVVLDRMIKNKYRRLPVLKDGKPIGIVYLSDIYYHLFSKDGAIR